MAHRQALNSKQVSYMRKESSTIIRLIRAETTKLITPINA